MATHPFDPLVPESFLSLETYRRDGSGVRTPVWHVVFEGRVFVFTERASWKVKRLRRDPSVRMAPCDWRGGSPGAWIEGQARVLGEDPARGPESDLITRVYEELIAKYGWQMRITNLLSGLAGRIPGRCELEISST